jgi:protein-tyrosine-phosphatase
MNVLFVCYGNVGRSQIAEAFFNSATEKHTAMSAGVIGEDLSYGVLGMDFGENIVRCMDEKGFDLRGNKPKGLHPRITEKSDLIIWMAPKEDVPTYLNNAKIIYWDVQDPGNASHEICCEVRDKIKNLVDKLIGDLR